MFKVLLVDDEPLALEGLKLVTDWESRGFRICGVCSNGEEAVALIIKESPDIVITDIRMPVMDGLALIEQVRTKLERKIKFIVLSGYGEFEYARQALRFEVNHYLLKPVFEEDLVTVLQEVAAQLRQINLPSRIRLGGTLYVRGLSKYYCLSIKAVLEKIIQGGGTAEYLPILQKFLDHGRIFQPWWCLIVETGYGVTAIADTSPTPARPAIDPLEAARRVAPTLFGQSCFSWELEQDCLVLLSGADGLNSVTVGERARQMAQKLTEAGVDGFYIAVGEPASELYGIHSSYQSARQALDNNFFTEVNQVIFAGKLPGSSFGNVVDGMGYLDALVAALEDFNREELVTAIGRAFAYFQAELFRPELVKMFISNIIYRSIRLIKEMNGNSNDLPQFETISRLNQEKITLADLKGVLLNYATECCQYLKVLQERNSQLNIYQIVEYIQQNFRRNLTLKEIAGNFYLHPAYLGQLFQKKFGFSFNEYLHRLRISEAQKLLCESDLRTHEIAVEVGYNNYHSFLDNFKKYTGVKPVEYKK